MNSERPEAEVGDQLDNSHVSRNEDMSLLSSSIATERENHLTRSNWQPISCGEITRVCSKVYKSRIFCTVTL